MLHRSSLPRCSSVAGSQWRDGPPPRSRSVPNWRQSCPGSGQRSPEPVTRSPSPGLRRGRADEGSGPLILPCPRRGGRGSGRGIGSVDFDLSEAGELVPNLVALAAFADGASTITGIGHIRHHETNRLAALTTEVNRLGGRITELDDGLHIEPAPLTGGGWRSYADHRMATTGALVGLVVPGIIVDDIACTSKTLPQFTRLWERILA